MIAIGISGIILVFSVIELKHKCGNNGKSFLRVMSLECDLLREIGDTFRVDIDVYAISCISLCAQTLSSVSCVRRHYKTISDQAC